jgi:hypothetical protein
MRKALRLALVGGAAAVSLAFASAALGAYAPSLTIVRDVNAGTGDGHTDIAYTETAADDALAKVTILSPAGFSATLTQAAGTQLGTLDGSVIAGALGGITVPVAGTIVVGDPANADLQATAQACTGTKTHAAIWLLNVTAAGQSLPAPVPLFVDPTATPPFSAFASAAIQLCLPPPPLAAFQIKLLSATLHVAGVFAPPATPGDFRWTAVNTPYKSDNSGVNALGTVETQAIDQTPLDATLSAKRKTKTRKVKHKKFTDIFYTYSAQLSGTVTAGGEGAAGANVDIMVGEDKVATATTNDSGKFTTTLKLAKTTTYPAVYTREAQPLLGASCVPPLPLAPGLDMPCGTIMSGGLAATTDDAKVVKPKLKKKRVKNKKKKGH